MLLIKNLVVVRKSSNERQYMFWCLIFVDLAMTGEITLRGVVLPVGGIKEKIIAAHSAGIKTILLPQRNRKELKDVPEHVKVTLSETLFDIDRHHFYIVIILYDFKSKRKLSFILIARTTLHLNTLRQLRK